MLKDWKSDVPVRRIERMPPANLTSSKEDIVTPDKANAGIAGQIVSNLHLGRSFAYAADMDRRIAALTPEDIKSAFRKFIDPKKLVIIRAGDFKK